MAKNEKHRFLDASEQYNLIPCVFKMDIKKSGFLKTIFHNQINDFGIAPPPSGWNLYDLRDGSKIIPENIGTDELVEMSEWELLDRAINIVRDDIRKNNMQVLSYCNLPEINPQIWFKDTDGKECWVVVRNIDKIEDDDFSNWKGIKEAIHGAKDFDGYAASVMFKAAEIMFAGHHYRGEGSFVRYMGMKKAYKTYSENAKL